MFQKFKSFFTRADKPASIPGLHGVTLALSGNPPAPSGGSGPLPVLPPPKVKAGSASFPSYLKTTTPSDSLLIQDDRRLATTDIVKQFRAGASTDQVLRDFTAASPDMAAAVFNYVRVGITKGYTAVAINPDGTFNPEATSLLQQIITRMDVMPNYADGFGGMWSLRSVSESWAKELVTYGACAGELVLDKTRLPYRIQPLSKTNVKFIADKDKTLKPVQVISGQRIDLDIPTFFYTALDQDLLTPYSSSFLEPGIKGVLFSEDFAQDLQRVVKRAVHPRLKVVIDEEKFRKNIPVEIAHDPNQVTTYLNSLISAIEAKVNDLKPEDALVFFDAIDVDYVNNGNISLSQEYTALSDIVNARLATGVKTMPSILGHGSGSQNVASTESMLFVKSVAGAVTTKLDEMYSRLFTLSVRLFGHDVVVKFCYEDINLRPEDELESFKAMKQSRVLELLSLGMLTDEEASIRLTGKLPPAGFKPLSGTMFYKAAPMAAGGAGPDPANPSNDGSALNQNLNGDAPKGVKSKNNTAGNTQKKAGVDVPLH